MEGLDPGVLAGIPVGAAIVVATVWTRLARVEKDVAKLQEQGDKDGRTLTRVDASLETLLGRVEDIAASLNVDKRRSDSHA